jgi:hypothetical protein
MAGGADLAVERLCLRERPRGGHRVAPGARQPERDHPRTSKSSPGDGESGRPRSTATWSTRAAGGPTRAHATSASMAAGAPTASASTAPSGRLRTHPASPSARASRCIDARYQTPCTRPVTTRCARSVTTPRGRAARTGGRPTRRDQLVEHAPRVALRRGQLRVPLHAEHERMRRQLDRLDDAVGAARGDLEPAAWAVDRLVMDRLHHHHGHAVGRPHTARGVDRHVVRHGLKLGRPMQHRLANHVGQVCDQRTTERDVEHLHAPADGEHRKPFAGDGRPHEAQLEAVALPTDGVVLPMVVPAIVAGVDVAATGKDQPVDAVEHAVDVGERGEEDRHAPRRGDRLDVRAGHREAGAPRAGSRVGGDADARGTSPS